MNKNWLLQLTVPIFEPSVFEEKLGTPLHVERLKMNKGVMMIVTPSQLFCLARDPVTRIRVFSFL